MTQHVLPNAQQMTGSWNELKGMIRQKWGQISGDDLERYRGNVDQLIGYLQQKSGESRDQIEDFLCNCFSSESSVLEGARETLGEAGVKASEYASKAGEYASRAGQAAQEQYQYASERLAEGYEGAQEMVRRRPVESLAFTFGAGVVAGLLLALTLRSR